MRSLFKLLISSILLVNCTGRMEDCNSQSLLVLSFYKNGGEIQESSDLHRDLKFKVTPEKGNNFSIFSNKKFYLPLYLNENYKCTSNDCKKISKDGIDTEIFNVQIFFKDYEIFNKKLKVEYDISPCFPVPSKTFFFDKEDNVWKPYKPEKISLPNEKGEPTNYEIEVKFTP